MTHHNLTTIEVRTCMINYMPISNLNVTTFPYSNPDVHLASMCLKKNIRVPQDQYQARPSAYKERVSGVNIPKINIPYILAVMCFYISWGINLLTLLCLLLSLIGIKIQYIF